MMRNTEKNSKFDIRNLIFKAALGVLLCALVFLAYGCTQPQPGETAEEVNRRHLRNRSINQQELIQDIDRAILTDEPSKLADKTIP